LQIFDGRSAFSPLVKSLKSGVNTIISTNGALYIIVKTGMDASQRGFNASFIQG